MPPSSYQKFIRIRQCNLHKIYDFMFSSFELMCTNHACRKSRLCCGSFVNMWCHRPHRQLTNDCPDILDVFTIIDKSGKEVNLKPIFSSNLTEVGKKSGKLWKWGEKKNSAETRDNSELVRVLRGFWTRDLQIFSLTLSQLSYFGTHEFGKKMWTKELVLFLVEYARDLQSLLRLLRLNNCI